MSQPRNSSPPPRFTLIALFELIGGIALVLGLLTELGCVGACIAGVAGTILYAADYVIFAEHPKQVWRDVQLGYFGCLILVFILMCTLPFASNFASGQLLRAHVARILVFTALTAVLVALAIVRRTRLARRLRNEGEGRA